MGIVSFRDKATEAINEGQISKQTQTLLPANSHLRAQIKMAILGAATSLTDLQELRGSCFESLKSDREGQYSIKINEQYRICFEWKSNNAYNVEITNY